MDTGRPAVRYRYMRQVMVPDNAGRIRSNDRDISSESAGVAALKRRSE